MRGEVPQGLIISIRISRKAIGKGGGGGGGGAVNSGKEKLKHENTTAYNHT